ncbi:ADP-ribosyl cyclase/cyclic ADP-ribose hydrolase 1-like isoform X2 [Acipenser ruthenus]|uniref:ADP-ribosyl cyclase/cyclic ADP-ribose hydrolase 1-like isoform X2 n=1 Tax=Acipenser ruthenus TaxID=7906 RepID=UPI002740F948|nr:ADP-ribosyl cyclase/cyclic ADP-ribose hydrolase 1-like isoform X2 [Acipenser ruthenus]
MDANMAKTVIGVVALLVLMIEGFQADTGTTKNLQEIVIGRCYNYIRTINPSIGNDCNDIWLRFLDAFLGKDPCDVPVRDYDQLFSTVQQTIPCNKVLLWSKTRDIVQSYSAVTHRFMTLDDTFIGYLFNALTWCGEKSKRELDYNSCPDWSTCENQPVASFWKKASEYFAESACGDVTVMLNGSIYNAFSNTSMLRSVEVQHLDPRKVNQVDIMVINSLRGPIRESCNSGSIVELIQILKHQGFRWTCTDNDKSLIILQCVRDPNHPSCKICNNSMRC